jgi:UDP-N-acetylmuramyl pentapeptide phosphotransferase/UDP-N-acetylglucosamine-1-phosphate transferase
MTGLAVAIASFLLCMAVIRLMLHYPHLLPVDVPNERSLHHRPVPRGGGVAVVCGIAAVLLFSGVELWPVLALMLGLATVSLADDLRGMPRTVRLVAHVAASAALVLWVEGFATALGIVLMIALAWITNVYNFMDGSDGLAGGMTVIGFGAYAAAAYQAGDPAVGALSLAIAAAAGAFLMHNFPPARVFLGDVGSIPLGFLAGGLGVVGWHRELWPLWFPFLVFGPFIADATITLGRRLLRGAPVWQAHREHYYQRLVRMGFGHCGTALLGYAVMAACAAIALLLRTGSPLAQASGFLAAALVLGLLGLWIDLRWSRHSEAA